jgi:serine protease AprX
VAIPERADGLVRRYTVDLAEVPDLAGAADGPLIRRLIVDRQMDVLADGLFHPGGAVTREDFARTLALNTPLRQSPGATARYGDVNGEMAPLAESVTANGATLRDFGFGSGGLMSASGAQFNPAGLVSRLDEAVAFVRALGHDAEARALAGTTVTAGGVPLTDNPQIPLALRGYVQVALDLGLLDAFPAEVRETSPGQFVALPGPRFEPAATVTRAALAVVVNRFAALFRTQ